MKIELEKIDDSLKITEYTIRKSLNKIDDDQYYSHCFQALVDIDGFEAKEHFYASFCYYDERGEFLGLDNDVLSSGTFGQQQPYPMSFDLNVPQNTQLVKCQITCDDKKISLWDLGWSLFAFLIFILLISHIVKIWI